MILDEKKNRGREGGRGKGGKDLFEEKSWWCWSWISLVQSETRVRYYSMERYFFFRILKFMERIFFSFFFSKNSLFFRYLTPFPLENPARYFRREATRNVKWINLKWWSVLKALFNWLLASPNDVGGRKGQGQVLQRNIGCVEQSNDGLMEFRCCFLPILHTITQIIP